MSARTKRKITILILVGTLALNIGGLMHIQNDWSVFKTPNGVGALMMVIGGTLLAWASDPIHPKYDRRIGDEKSD